MFLCSLGEVLFSESSLGALWDHDTNDVSYMCSEAFQKFHAMSHLQFFPSFSMTLLDVTGLGFFFLFLSWF